MAEHQQDPETHAIIGAAMEVHGTLGCRHLEAVYQDALEIEFTDRRIRYVREAQLRIRYKGRVLRSTFRADFVCFGSVLVETKALRSVGVREDAQVLNYLEAIQLDRALLLNFATPRLTFQRYVRGWGT